MLILRQFTNEVVYFMVPVFPRTKLLAMLTLFGSAITGCADYGGHLPLYNSGYQRSYYSTPYYTSSAPAPYYGSTQYYAPRPTYSSTPTYSSRPYYYRGHKHKHHHGHHHHHGHDD